jgi:choline-sulfatase
LCGLEPRTDLDGLSLAPQLKDPAAKRERPAITSHNQGNHGIRSERYRYILYADGSEELYDLELDPWEWTNLAADPRHASVLSSHRQWLPKPDNPPAIGSAHRVLTYDRATGRAVWEGKSIAPIDPIPE